jgi:hypothetical protein
VAIAECTAFSHGNRPFGKVDCFACVPSKLDIPLSDTTICDKLLGHLNAQPWAHVRLLDVTVNNEVVNLWSITVSETERKAIRVAAETASTRAVNDHVMMKSLVQ